MTYSNATVSLLFPAVTYSNATILHCILFFFIHTTNSIKKAGGRAREEFGKSFGRVFLFSRFCKFLHGYFF